MTELHPLLISYYDEIDPPKRYEHLKEYTEAVGSGMTPADVYRIALFNARHSAPNAAGLFGIFGKSKARGNNAGSGNDSSVPNPPGELDVFLREILVMLTIYKNGGPFPKRNRKRHWENSKSSMTNAGKSSRRCITRTWNSWTGAPGLPRRK